jgi:microcystin-dependent protein
MDAAITALAAQISGPASTPLTMRIAAVTAVQSAAGAKVQTSETGTGWINRSEDTSLVVGDRVWLLNQGAAWVVGGRLSGESSANPIGGLMPYAGTAAPPGWHLADGAALSRTTYATLFAICGTTYGTGDGSTTFNLPNLTGRVVMGVSGSHALGVTGGAENINLSTAQLPAHDHGGVGDHTHSAGTGTGAATVASGSGASVSNATGATTGSAGGHTHSSVGSGSAVSVLQPYEALNYIIRIL